MNSQELKRLRTASVLKELLSEAICALSDPFLRGLCVNEVDCKRGRYEAFVYLDKMALDENEQKIVLEKLKKARNFLQNYCLESQGWYRAPNLHFKFDDTLERQNKMDALFAKIDDELQGAKND